MKTSRGTSFVGVKDQSRVLMIDHDSGLGEIKISTGWSQTYDRSSDFIIDSGPWVDLKRIKNENVLIDAPHFGRLFSEAFRDDLMKSRALISSDGYSPLTALPPKDKYKFIRYADPDLKKEGIEEGIIFMVLNTKGRGHFDHFAVQTYRFNHYNEDDQALGSFMALKKAALIGGRVKAFDNLIGFLDQLPDKSPASVTENDELTRGIVAAVFEAEHPPQPADHFRLEG